MPEAPDVLLVDDEPEMLNVLAQVIRMATGGAVVTAPNGQEALRILKARRFAIVVSDFQMPGMNGFELARAIRDRNGPPVILMSAFADSALRAQALNVPGVLDWLPKTLDPIRLMEAVRVHAGASHGPSPPAAATAASQNPRAAAANPAR